MVFPASYVPPPGSCEPIAALVDRFAGTWLRPSTSCEAALPLPQTGSVDVSEFWRARSEKARPGPAQEGVARLAGGRVFGSGIVLAPDGSSVARDVSLDFGRAEDTHWLLGDAKMKSPEFVPGVSTVVASALGEGYCHWLLDELPRLLSLPVDVRDSTLIAHAQTECSRTALALFGWKGTTVEATRRAHRQCEQLLVPLLPGWTGRATRRQIELISDFADRLPAAKSDTPGERIFVSRALARRRRVSNEAEVAAGLAAIGFATVRLEELTWAEQAACFRRARVVVAPHGAGLANLVFCAPGTRIVECFQRSYVNECFWQIAAIRGLDYRAVLSEGPDPLDWDPRANRVNFAVDVGRLLAALR